MTPLDGDRPQSGSSYAGTSRIKFAGLETISAQILRTPGSASIGDVARPAGAS